MLYRTGQKRASRCSVEPGGYKQQGILPRKVGGWDAAQDSIGK